MSGPASLEVAAAVCRGVETGFVPARRPCPVSWRLPDASGEVPADLFWMPAPRSFTREDVIEIHTLGSPPLLRLLCERLIEAGARPAGPGEFTRRAYLNGRLDLAQAESVMALIGAADRAALAGALAGLAGGLSRRCRGIEEGLVALCAEVEAAIDFTDRDIAILTPEAAAEGASRLAAAVESLRAEARAGAPWRPGMLVLLFGPPNAGKSSLFNALLGAPQSIVSAQPGTTRDLLEAEAEWEGIAFRLVDAAGVRPAAGAVEAEAVARAERLAGEADLLVVVLDGSGAAPGAGPAEGGDGGPFVRGLRGRRGIVVLNKSDLGCARPPADAVPEGDASRVVRASARTGAGVARVRSSIVAEARRIAAAGPAERLACSVRQGEALERAAEALRRAAGAARRESSFEFAAADLREALSSLGSITGRVTTEDLLGAIFTRFCVGK